MAREKTAALNAPEKQTKKYICGIFQNGTVKAGQQKDISQVFSLGILFPFKGLLKCFFIISLCQTLSSQCLYEDFVKPIIEKTEGQKYYSVTNANHMIGIQSQTRMSLKVRLFNQPQDASRAMPSSTSFYGTTRGY